MTSTQDDSSLHRVAAAASRNAPGTPSALSSVLHLVEQDLARVELLLRRPPGGHSRCATAAADLVAAGGKRLRPALCLLSHRLAASDRETGHDAVVQLAAAVEFLHSASLLHDDVIDEASCRRGAPAARVRWGNTVSVIAGDLLLVRALQKVHDLGDRWLDALTDRTLHAIVEGEVAQLEARGKLETDANRFRYVAERKTASLFVLAMVGGARLGGADEGLLARVEEFARWLGLAFQLRDDLLDVCGTAEQLGKSAGQDLATGCITLPLADVLAHSESLREAVTRHLQSRDGCDLPRELAVALGEVAGSPGVLDRSRGLLREWNLLAFRALSSLPEGPERDTLSWAVDYLAIPAVASYPTPQA